MRKAVAALVVLVLAAAASSALGAPAHRTSNSQTYLDSTGEDPSAPDITSVVVSNDDSGLITFKVNISNRPALTSDMEIDLYLDTDANPSTGDKDVYGADYAIILVAGEVDLIKWNGTTYTGASSQSSLVYSYDTSGATIKINASDLGGTNAFDFVSLAASGITVDANGDPDYDTAAIDFAPDVGHGAFAYQVRSTLRLDVTTFETVPVTPKAGATFSASLAATENDTGAPFSGGSVACRATAGGKVVPVTSHSVANGVASCVWRIPRTAKGKRLSGTVTVTVRGAKASKSFSAKVR